MYEFPKMFKEVIPESTQVDRWKELCFTSVGTPISLQDIKVVPHSGGYAYTELSNRFIYWRTNYDVLEMVEHSLDTNLCGNQIRFKFQNAPILEGVAIQERGGLVIILVPTVSSVHRLTFSHPAYERNDSQSSSIFMDVTAESLFTPTSYHTFSTLPFLPHTAASILGNDDDNAIFCLALNNSSIMLINLQRLTGMAVVRYLKYESSVRKSFLSGITGVLMGGKLSDDNNTVSMALERHNDDVYLFAVNRIGQIRVWCCAKMQCIYEYDVRVSGQMSPMTQCHMLRKMQTSSKLTISVHLSSPEKSHLLVLSSTLRKENFSFNSTPVTCEIPSNVDIIDMNISNDSQIIWSIWRYRDTGEVKLFAFCINSRKQSLFVKDNKGFKGNDYLKSQMSPREYYLNLIFAPGLFSISDIRKVLNIYRGTPQFEHSLQKADLRSKVCVAVEMEIQTETVEYEFPDEEYVEIAERCWSKFYLNCLQYKEAGKTLNSLFWIPSASLLAVISKNNISFYRAADVLEEALTLSEECSESQSYKHLLCTLSKMELSDEHRLYFSQSLKRFHSLKQATADIALELKLEKKLNLEIETLMKYPDLQYTLRTVSDILFMPETFEQTVDYCDSFKSDLGMHIVYLTIRQLVHVRLNTCRNLAILLSVLDNSEIRDDFLAETLNLCRAYNALEWCCEAVVRDHPQLISLMQLFLHKSDFGSQTLLLDAAWSVLQYLWPLTNSFNLAEFLFQNKYHNMLKCYSRLINCKSWILILIQSFLETNEPYKAYDLIIKSIDTPETYLKLIKLFENVEQSDIAINLVKKAIDKASKTFHPDLPTLYSILFLHHLKLGHYELAFVNLEKNPDRSRRVDCLRELVITLMNSNLMDKLLGFPYNDLLSELENIMEQRARSLPPAQATLYYNFLYALYVRHDNYRKAARIMFEQGHRSENNKQQMLSYAMCLNCISLVNHDQAWVLKPTYSKSSSNCMESALDIYEVPELTKEFALASARSKLINCPPDISASEVVMKLISASRYRLALKIASLFKLKLEPIFEALAAVCTRIAEDPDPWSWLVENDISDFIVGDENATVVAWRLLQALLEKYEEPNLTTLHKAVACKIMSLDVLLPYWLEVSYKKRNPSELLHLHLRYGELNEASKLCCEIVAASLGKGKELFRLESTTACDKPIGKRFPLNSVNLLLEELRAQQMNNLYEEVKNAVEIYLESMHRITATYLCT